MNDDHANLEARPGVSVIIVNYNGGTELLDCVEALEHEAPLAEVLVVDNASVDGSAHACTRRFPHVRVLYSEENLGFAGGANLGAAHATTGIFVFLNPDTMPGPGCMSQLYEELSARGGVAGPLVSHEGQSLVEQGLTIDRMGLARGLTEPSPALYVSGCCLGTTRECFEAVGGLDDRYFLFCEDIEYCWQALRRGYDVRVVPTATLKHVGGTAAPGGYRRNNRIETTSVRILLGGRNSLAMFLACAPLWVMPGLICASLLRSGFFATLLLTNRRPRDAARLITGICWNVEQLPATRRRRHRPGVTPSGERAAWARVSRRLFLWDHMRAGERARFVDAPRGQRPSPGVPTASLQGAKNPRGGKPADPSAEGFAEQ